MVVGAPGLQPASAVAELTTNASPQINNERDDLVPVNTFLVPHDGGVVARVRTMNHVGPDPHLPLPYPPRRITSRVQPSN